MNHPALVALFDKLREGGHSQREVGEVPAARYTSPEWFDREREAIFARTPQLVAAGAELAAPGACLAMALAGVPVILTSTKDGTLAAHHNSCRHRSTQFVPEGPPCRKTALVCPYHGWTYDLSGRLVHVPHEETFAGRCDERRALRPAHAAARHGLVWASLEPFDVSSHLGGIDAELGAFELESATLYRRTEREVRGNWKLVIDAFLDGYHLRHLHRDSIYPFFLDGSYEAQREGRHIRSVVGRRGLFEGEGPLRAQVTPTYFVFPNTIAVLHPDFVSLLTCSPLSVDRTRFVHLMWVSQDPGAPRWAKSHALIDERVFGVEDLGVVEAIQGGLRSPANDTLLFGTLEEPVLWFHQLVAAAVADCFEGSTPRSSPHSR